MIHFLAPNYKVVDFIPTSHIDAPFLGEKKTCIPLNLLYKRFVSLDDSFLKMEVILRPFYKIYGIYFYHFI